MKRKYVNTILMTIVSYSFIACQNYTKDQTLLGEPDNIAKEERIVIDTVGLSTDALEFSINSDVYTVYESGRFDRYFTSFFDIAIEKDPKETRCNLFDYQDNTSVLDNAIECYPSSIAYKDTVIKVGDWNYTLSGNSYVLYSSEAIGFDDEGNTTYTTKAGLYIDDDRIGNTVEYVVDEQAVDDAVDVYEVHNAIKQIVSDMSGVASVKNRYEYDSYPLLVTEEYLVTFEKGIKPADVIKSLSDSFKERLGSVKLLLQPHTTLEAQTDVDIVLSVDLFYSSSESVFHLFRARTLKVMGENKHFPTLDLKK